MDVIEDKIVGVGLAVEEIMQEAETEATLARVRKEEMQTEGQGKL